MNDKEKIALEEKDELQLESIDATDASFSTNTHQYNFNEIVWRNVILLAMLHIAAVYAWYLFMIDETIKWQTSVATFVFGLFSSSLGITAGAHRLWSHRSYKARWPLRYNQEYYRLIIFMLIIYLYFLKIVVGICKYDGITE